MNQHINSMLEHLSSLRRKNSDSAQTTSNDKQADAGHKEVNDVDTVNSKTKNSIFKNLISDNGGTNIFQNLIKCPESISSHLSMSSSSNGSCKQKANSHDDDNNNQQASVNTVAVVQLNTNEGSSNGVHKKRNSVVKTLLNSNGELNISRDLSPSPRAHRKSSHDIRLLRNNQPIPENGESTEVGKLSGVKPLKTKNIITKNETFDMLHCRATDALGCSNQVCLGSIMIGNVVGVETRKQEVLHQHAKDFLNQYFTSIRRFNSPAHQARWKQIEDEIQVRSGYQLNDSELIFGAKTAWRNSARCIGRIQWSKLQVFDCRQLSTPSQMFEALCNHLKYSTNKGNLRSAITIFPQRTDGKHDFRIWNPQLISYAGYQNPDGTITGDPVNVEITEVCLKLGWKTPRSEFDILPLVLSANGHDPEMFEYPPDLILEVPLSHPQFKWFAEMNLKWYAVPAVSSMQFDCGGLVFPGCAFSGWYMSTEIGCRNLCDTNRRNLLEPIAIKMGLDTRNPTSLWKDKALVEINIAVLHSYQKSNVTIVDHHTASESFMKHYENEFKQRNGCPADWVWIVPPMSSSVTQVFHQEMSVYYLRPSFEYQELPMKTHVWEQERNSIPRRKLTLKQVGMAIKFASLLYVKALSRRVKATVLYATETGRSEQFGKQLVELLGHAFNANIYSMADYDINLITSESLLFVVASTFGNGDPPENGEQFAHSLHTMKNRNDVNLSKTKFAVFALGSSSYPNFCAFGKFIDDVLGDLGGDRLMDVALGDDLSGQEQEFRQWGRDVFKKCGEVFGLDMSEMSKASMSLKTITLTKENTRFHAVNNLKIPLTIPLDVLLSKFHNKKVEKCKIKRNPINLHGEASSKRSTVLVEITKSDGSLNYEPGDHVGVCPMNRADLVDGILAKLTGVANPDEDLQLQTLHEKHTSNGTNQTWETHGKIPTCGLRTLLTRFMDITSPPSRQFLTFLSGWCENEDEKKQMEVLATESAAYEDWRHNKLPHLLEVFDEFPSCRPPAALFVAHLMALQPRFYSISSSQKKYPNEVHLTVAIVKYKTNDGKADERYGVCSNYLERLERNEEIQIFVRSAPSFHLPKDSTQPIILIGPGTGTAPFRSFWQELDEIKSQNASFNVAKVWLFFGCRAKSLDLYSDEKREMLEKGILDKVFLALSREVNVPKTYVQNLIMKETSEICNLIKHQRAHIYVCGDVQMAENVYQTLRKIIAISEKQSEAVAEKFMLQLRDENRYHEDIFGITLRTAEIHNKSRETAKIKMESLAKLD